MTSRVEQSQLDFLRGFAALYVVASHVRARFFVGGEKLLAGHPSGIDYLTVGMLQATSLAASMVIMFFVLSGFAMAHSVKCSSSVKRFYVKRIVRIWPPYIAASCLAVIVGLVTGTADLRGHLLGLILYFDPITPMTVPFWSLPYEVIFYALCPLLLWNARVFGVLAVISAAVGLAVVGPVLDPHGSIIMNFFGCVLILFAIGALSYHYFDRIPFVSGKTLIILICAAFPVVWLLKRFVGDTDLSANLIVAFVTVLSIKNMPRKIPSWLNAGYFSYSIYIFHFPLIIAAMAAFRSFGFEPTQIANPLLWIAMIPLIVLGCFALYWCTERLSNQAVARLRGSSHQREAVALQVRSAGG